MKGEEGWLPWIQSISKPWQMERVQTGLLTDHREKPADRVLYILGDYQDRVF